MNFIKDQKGVAAVEFALLTPVLLVLFVGFLEITNYMTVARRAEMSGNSMAQVLANAGGGQSSTMHHVWHIPSQINPTAHMNYRWGNGKTWRVPFSFSQVFINQKDPDCEKNCEMKPSRDFMFAYGGGKRGMFRRCRVNVLAENKKAQSNLDLPEGYMARVGSVMMVGHTTQYKPVFANFFGEKADRLGVIALRKISYATRYDGEIYNYYNNGHGMYRYCNGPSS